MQQNFLLKSHYHNALLYLNRLLRTDSLMPYEYTFISLMPQLSCTVWWVISGKTPHLLWGTLLSYLPCLLGYQILLIFPPQFLWNPSSLFSYRFCLSSSSHYFSPGYSSNIRGEYYCGLFPRPQTSVTTRFRIRDWAEVLVFLASFLPWIKLSQSKISPPTTFLFNVVYYFLPARI